MPRQDRLHVADRTRVLFLVAETFGKVGSHIPLRVGTQFHSVRRAQPFIIIKRHHEMKYQIQYGLLDGEDDLVPGREQPRHIQPDHRPAVHIRDPLDKLCPDPKDLGRRFEKGSPTHDDDIRCRIYQEPHRLSRQGGPKEQDGGSGPWARGGNP